MTGTELLVIVVCLALGYWIIAVFVPSLMETDVSLEDTEPRARQSDAGTSEPALHDGAREWFEVLGIPEASLREDIVIAYKRKIRQYHPDLVARMGPELRELAELKSKEINAAYEIALNLRSATYPA